MSSDELSGEAFEKGLRNRIEVLGERYVERSLEQATDLSVPLQKLITEWCWGEVWGRPGLDRRSRSILNMGMLIASNRQNELRTHMLGALNNGVTRDELVEIVLQSAIYCGAPASLDAMKALNEVVEKVDAEARARVNGAPQ